MMNNVTLVGRLSKDIELRYTGSGIAVASFTLAVERSYTNAQGERETDFVNCVIWRAPAENLANFAVKGSLIGITGAIQTRNYENNEGRKVYVTEVVANNFQLLEPKAVTDKRREQAGQSNQNNQQGQQQNTQQSQQQNNNQFGNNDYSNDPFASNTEVTEISDDDLPF